MTRRQPRMQPEVLPGMETIEPPRPEPWQVAERVLDLAQANRDIVDAYDPTKKRMAAARLFGLSAAAHVIEQEDFHSITNEMVDAVAPATLFSAVVGQEVIDRDGVRGKQATWYQDKKGIWHKVALSSTEKRLLPGDIVAYTNAAGIDTKKGPKQQLMINPDPNAPSRAVVHALDALMPKLEKYSDHLRTDVEIVHKLVEALHPRHTGLARMGSEFAMQNAAERVHGMINGLADAYADQHGLDKMGFDNVKRAILFNAFVNRSRNEHLRYDLQLCRVLRDYSTIKLRAFEFTIAKGHEHRASHITSQED